MNRPNILVGDCCLREYGARLSWSPRWPETCKSRSVMSRQAVIEFPHRAIRDKTHMSSDMVTKVLVAEEHLLEREFVWELLNYTRRLTVIDGHPRYFRERFTYPGLRQRRSFLCACRAYHSAYVGCRTSHVPVISVHAWSDE